MCSTKQSLSPKALSRGFTNPKVSQVQVEANVLDPAAIPTVVWDKFCKEVKDMKSIVQPLGEAMETVFAPFITQQNQTPQNTIPPAPAFPQAQTQRDASSTPAPTTLFLPDSSSLDCKVVGTLLAPPDSQNTPPQPSPQSPPATLRPILKRKQKMGIYRACVLMHRYTCF